MGGGGGGSRDCVIIDFLLAFGSTFFFHCCRGVLRMRHGVPEIKMKIDLLTSYILQILLTGRGSTGHILLL